MFKRLKKLQMFQRYYPIQKNMLHLLNLAYPALSSLLITQCPFSGDNAENLDLSSFSGSIYPHFIPVCPNPPAPLTVSSNIST